MFVRVVHIYHSCFLPINPNSQIPQCRIINLGDAGKLIDDEKNSLTDTRADSGFISGGNLELSGEIPIEGIIPEHHQDRRISDVVCSSQSDSGIIEDNEKKSNESSSMHIDSGLCLTSELSLSEKISKLKQLNDLNNPKGAVTQQPPVDDAPWNIYYQQDEDGDTHLHSAIFHGIPEVALALIRAAPHRSLLDTPNDSAQTPLHLAVETSQPPVARWLIIAGAKPCPRDAQGNSPLHIAARLGDLKCVKAITDPVNPKHREIMSLGYPPAPQYEKPDLNQWNYIGQTCVHTAAKHGQLEVLKHLVASGANINAREGLEGLTALHYAILNRDEKMVKYLLTECRSLVPDLRNYAGNNAWQWSLVVPDAMMKILKLRGVESPYSSEEEDSSSEDEEMSYDNQVHRFSLNLVNASA